jgi:hypothetical protein
MIKQISFWIRTSVVLLALCFTVGCFAGCKDKNKDSDEDDDVEITLSHSAIEISAEEQFTLTAQVSDGSTLIMWRSDNIAVASVSGGLVTAIMPGTARITAMSGGAMSGCTVTVTEPKITTRLIVFSSDAVGLIKEKTADLNVSVFAAEGETVAWSSNDPAVFTAQGKGVVNNNTAVVQLNGVNVGEAKLTAEIGHGETLVSATVTIKVNDSVEIYFMIFDEGGWLATDKSYDLDFFAVVNGAEVPGLGNEIAVTSANPAIAQIDNDRINAVNEGDTVLTAKYGVAAAKTTVSVRNRSEYGVLGRMRSLDNADVSYGSAMKSFEKFAPPGFSGNSLKIHDVSGDWIIFRVNQTSNINSYLPSLPDAASFKVRMYIETPSNAAVSNYYTCTYIYSKASIKVEPVYVSTDYWTDYTLTVSTIRAKLSENGFDSVSAMGISLRNNAPYIKTAYLYDVRVDLGDITAARGQSVSLTLPALNTQNLSYEFELIGSPAGVTLTDGIFRADAAGEYLVRCTARGTNIITTEVQRKIIIS